MPFLRRYLFVLVAFTFTAGCTTAELAVDLAKKYKKTQDEELAAEAVQSGATSVVARPRYKVGDPYQVAGQWYYPERDLTYDETGIGSWYGDEFAGRLTANGEIFEPSLVSAAHKTLPMPSVVRVTNLDNGRSLVVRVNDRGPFVSGRIIDLSREAARLLGFQKKGIARVRVQILTDESLRLEKLAKQGEFPLFHEEDKELPKAIAAEQPKVSLSARTTRASSEKPKAGQSSVELLSAARSGAVLQTDPIITDLWVQVGAFHSEDNAQNMLAKLKTLADGRISQTYKNGVLFYRVQLGPITDISAADNLLQRALQQGYGGARIVAE